MRGGMSGIARLFYNYGGDMITIPRIIILNSMIGVYFINWKKNKTGFIILGASAFAWCFWNLHIGQNEQALSTGISGVTSIIGWFKWWHDEHKTMGHYDYDEKTKMGIHRDYAIISPRNLPNKLDNR